MKQRGVTSYQIHIEDQIIPLSIGENHIRKKNIKDFAFCKELKEDHFMDITIDRVDNITIKNLTSIPLTLRVCSYSKPVILIHSKSHTFKKIAQLSMTFKDSLKV